MYLTIWIIHSSLSSWHAERVLCLFGGGGLLELHTYVYMQWPYKCEKKFARWSSLSMELWADSDNLFEFCKIAWECNGITNILIDNRDFDQIPPPYIRIAGPWNGKIEENMSEQKKFNSYYWSLDLSQLIVKMKSRHVAELRFLFLFIENTVRQRIYSAVHSGKDPMS